MSTPRPTVMKTLKLYVGGAFIRSESGRVTPQLDHRGVHVAQLPMASRKDMRNAVVIARGAAPKWASTTPFLKSQILYRMAEMVQGRAATLEAVLVNTHGASTEEAAQELQDALDTIIYFAGWCDKYAATFGGTNPVAGPFLNVSTLEPMGVVAGFLPTKRPLLAAAAAIAIAASAGNTALWFAPPECGQLLLELGEVIATSDIPAGVVNLLVASPESLRDELGGHRDINAFVVHGADPETREVLERKAADSIARVAVWPWTMEESDAAARLRSPWPAVKLMEVKTAWHPLGA